MKARMFNWKLIAVFIMTLVMLGATALMLRQWQIKRLNERTVQDLEAGLQAYERFEWDQAAELLSKYLAFNKGDTEVWLKFAEAQLNTRPLLTDNVNRAAAAYRTILRVEKTNCEAARKLTALFLDIDVPAEAELIATNFLKEKEDPEVRRGLAISLAEQRSFDQAETHLKNVIDNYPSFVPAYDTIARIIEQHAETFPGSTPEYWYDLAVANNPSSAEAIITRADFYSRRRSNERAVSDLKTVEEMDLSDPLVRLKLAGCYLDAHLLDNARGHLARVREQSPDTWLLWRLWAAVASEGGSKDEMAEVAAAGLRENRRQRWDFVPIAAELFIRAGRLSEAADCLAELKKEGVAPLPTLYLEGLLAEGRGQDHSAIQYWRKAGQCGYKSDEMVFGLARAYRRTGDMQSAIRELQSFTSGNSDNVYAQLMCSDLYAEIGDWKDTLGHLNPAAKIASNDPEIAFRTIRAKMRLAATEQNGATSGVWAEYEKQLSALEEKVEDKLPIRLLRAEAAMRNKDFAKAQQIVDELRGACNGRLLEVETTEAELLISQNKNDEAIEKLYALTNRFPQELLPVRYLLALPGGAARVNIQAVLENLLKNANGAANRREAVLLLSGFYQKQGRQEDAVDVLKKACTDMPDDIPLKRRLLELVRRGADVEYAQRLVDEMKAVEGERGWQWRWEQARLWIDDSNNQSYMARAISLLKENLSVNPSDRNSLLLLASAYEAGGQSQLAVATYREALEAEPDDVQILVGAIRAFYKAGQRQEADRLLNRAIEQEPSHPAVALLQLQRNLRRGEYGSAEAVLENLLQTSQDDDILYLPLALVQMRRDKFEEARQLLNDLKAQEPQSVPVTAALVELDLRMKMKAEAIQLCDEIVSKNGVAAAYILRAKTHAAVGDTGKAQADFDRAVAIEPDNADAWMARSGFYAAVGEQDGAVSDIERALELAPDDIQVRKQAIALSTASDRLDKRQAGKRLMDAFLAAEPDDVDVLLSKARYLMRAGATADMQEAEKIFDRVTQFDSDNIEAWSMWVQLYLDQSRVGEAVDAALRGLSHRPENRSLLLLKAKAEAARSPVLAIPTLMVLNEQDPGDVGTAVQLANAYTAGGQGSSAVEALERLVASCSEGDRKRADIALATGLYANGLAERAKEEFDALYAEYPRDGTLLIGETEALVKSADIKLLNERILHWLGRNPDDTETMLAVAGKLATDDGMAARTIAESLSRQMLLRDADCARAMEMLAMLLQSSGRTNEAAEVYTRLLKKEKNNVVAINNLAWILCEAEHRYAQALELAKRGLEESPDYADLIDTCGVIYFRLGEHKEAVESLSQCIKMYPENSQALVASRFHLARALAALGEEKGAIENLKLSLDLHDKVGGLSQSEVAEADSLRRALLEGQANVTITK
jgi:tetratricopeptide (TPR) repeat protein